MFRGPLTVLSLRLGAVALVYSLTRVLFVALNSDHFQDVPIASYLGGVRFDGFAIAWINLPWVLLFFIHPKPGNKGFRAVQLWLFLLLNATALFFQFVDIEFYNFSLKRSTADFLRIMTTGNDTANLAPAFLRDFWYMLLLYLGSLVALYWAYRRAEHRSKAATLWAWRIGWRAIAVIGLGIASRGGSQLIPLQVLDAAQYGGVANLPVTLNTPYTMLTSWGKPTLEEKRYVSRSEADLLWPVHHHYTDTFNLSGRPNVVVVILESFSAAYSARLSGEEGYMPFLDSLMGESLNMTHAYANGRRSIDGVPAILASIPELMDEAFISSPYASLPFTSLANTLGPEGYTTSFYHGGRNGTMGFDGFIRSAGFSRYVGLNEYTGDPTDHDGHWGIRDKPFLQFWAQELAREKEPFLSCMFTLSSHHPYELPSEDVDRFAGGTQKIHPTLRYADDALRRFFDTARSMPWYANTLFVITADHTADIDRSGQHYTKATDYQVPLLYHMPGRIMVQQQPRVTQHIDILPTILDLLGYEKPFFSFGHSALRLESPPYAVMASNGIYQCIGDRSQLQFDGATVLDATTLRASETAPFGEQEALVTADMTRRLQAAIQQFNGHMIRGELVERP
ncbi:MAG TPA: LTA synthase family protein [Flavobacteriales bacterium]|nr:LTA synthase family protein [Flavobacteriales bacterium]